MFDRTISSPNRKIFHDLNPKAQRHWYYKDILKFHEDQQAADPDYGYNYGHFTIADNMSISGEQLRQILKTYDKNSVWYKRDILGNRCIADGLVYPMFEESRHVLKSLPETEGDYYVSSDFGVQNATVFLLWRKERGESRWICLREYYYSGTAEQRQATVSKLVDGLCGILNGITPKRVIVDPSAAPLKVELRQKGYYTQNAQNDVLYGISDVCSLLEAGGLAFMPCCKRTIEEFGSYLWDRSAAERGEDAPLKENDHCMDSVRYFARTMRLVKRAGKNV